jgi:hypothetical protein
MNGRLQAEIFGVRRGARVAVSAEDAADERTI